MPETSDLSATTLLQITFRVEPGSLGPQGRDHVEAFCGLAQQALKPLDAAVMALDIVPRLDKSKPEIECHLSGKKLTQTQMDQWLQSCGYSFDQVEDYLAREISQLIKRYRQRL